MIAVRQPQQVGGKIQLHAREPFRPPGHFPVAKYPFGRCLADQAAVVPDFLPEGVQFGNRPLVQGVVIIKGGAKACCSSQALNWPMRERVRVSWSGGVQTTGDCSVLLIRLSRKLLHMPAVADHDRLAGQGSGREGCQMHRQF